MIVKPPLVFTPINTEPPFTPNPFRWRRFADVYMGNYILGEDIVDLASLGFCGETVTVSCATCGEIFGHVPVELAGVELGDIAATHIAPLLAWHDEKYHPRSGLKPTGTKSPRPETAMKTPAAIDSK